MSLCKPTIKKYLVMFVISSSTKLAQVRPFVSDLSEIFLRGSSMSISEQENSPLQDTI